MILRTAAGVRDVWSGDGKLFLVGLKDILANHSVNPKGGFRDREYLLNPITASIMVEPACQVSKNLISRWQGGVVVPVFKK